MLFNAFPIQTFVNSNRCNITPPHAYIHTSRFAKLNVRIKIFFLNNYSSQGELGPPVYGTVDDGGNYVTISRFAKLNVRIKIFF